MEDWDGPAARDATPLIAPLQQGVLAWMDADRVLPADGSSLLAALERAHHPLRGYRGLTGESAPPASLRRVPTQWVDARAGIEAFIAQVQALIETGVLEIADGHPLIAAAAAVVVWLRSADGSDG